MGASLEQRGASLCCKLDNHTACPVALNPPASPSLNPLRAWNSTSSAISSFAWAAAITLNASTPQRFNTPKHSASTLHSYPITKPDMPKATALPLYLRIPSRMSDTPARQAHKKNHTNLFLHWAHPWEIGGNLRTQCTAIPSAAFGELPDVGFSELPDRLLTKCFVPPCRKMS